MAADGVYGWASVVQCRDFRFLLIQNVELGTEFGFSGSGSCLGRPLIICLLLFELLNRLLISRTDLKKTGLNIDLRFFRRKIIYKLKEKDKKNISLIRNTKKNNKTIDYICEELLFQLLKVFYWFF